MAGTTAALLKYFYPYLYTESLTEHRAAVGSQLSVSYSSQVRELLLEVWEAASEKCTSTIVFLAKICTKKVYEVVCGRSAR